jgi:hypothetical protein
VLQACRLTEKGMVVVDQIPKAESWPTPGAEEMQSGPVQEAREPSLPETRSEHVRRREMSGRAEGSGGT